MTKNLEILFFASLAEQVNCRELSLPWTPDLASVAALRDHLCRRGGAWELLSSDQLRCAVNQEIVKIDHPLRAGDEVAFFPPVTGG